MPGKKPASAAPNRKRITPKLVPLFSFFFLITLFFYLFFFYHSFHPIILSHTLHVLRYYCAVFVSASRKKVTAASMAVASPLTAV